MVIHRHQVLAPKTFPRRSRSLRPRPPAFFGFHILFHATNSHLPLFSLPFQRKSLWIYFIWLEMDLGDAIAEYWYLGIAWRTKRTRTSLPERFRDRKVQLEIIFCSLVIKDSHIPLAKDLSVRVTPKYIEGNALSWKPKMQEMLF